MAEDPIALFDMDGTLADYEGQLATDLNAMRCPDEPEVTPENLHRDWEPWMERRIHVIKRQPGWWAKLPPFRLGWEVLEMARCFFAIHILTKGPSSNFDAWKEKGEWIRTHLGTDVVIHMTESKRIHYGRVLVDDFSEYIKEWLIFRPRGLVVMPANAGNIDFKHPNVIRYDGTPESRTLVSRALIAAHSRKDKQSWQELMSPEGERQEIVGLQTDPAGL